MTTSRVIRPHPGMQTRMMTSPAQICAVGARAGVGKSYGLILSPTHFVARRLPATCVIFRRRAMDLEGSSSIVGKARRVYGAIGGEHRQAPFPDFRWRASGFGHSQTAVEFRSLPEPQSVEAHQGADYDFIGFDELTHFTLDQFEYLRTRLRSLVDAPFQPHIRLTLNPVPGGWIRDLFDWWIGEDGLPIREREGVLRWVIKAPDDWPTAYVVGDREKLLEQWPDMRPSDLLSLTLIPGRPEDNPTQNWPAYEAQLRSQKKHIRASLLEGNWDVMPEDQALIWEMPTSTPFTDDDPDFLRFCADAQAVELFGGWDYGRAMHGLSWILGALEPGAKPVLWIIGARVWTGASAETAAADRAAFLETLDLPLRVGDVRDCGDPSGHARDSGPGWYRSLQGLGVPMVDLRHSMTEDGRKLYWNTPQGFGLTVDLVQSWLDSGRLRVRVHPSTAPVLEALRKWRLAVPEGMAPIAVNRDQIPPDKGVHSHPGDALRYLVAFVAATLRGRGAEENVAPSSDVVAHAQAMRAAAVIRSRGVSRGAEW